MLSRILPERIDNRYRGHPLALWLFVPITLQKLALSATHLFKADGHVSARPRVTRQAPAA